MYPQRHAAYTYTNFLRAVSAFPGVCHPDSAATCRAVLATMFAHFAQVTTISTTYLQYLYNIYNRRRGPITRVAECRSGGKGCTMWRSSAVTPMTADTGEGFLNLDIWIDLK